MKALRALTVRQPWAWAIAHGHKTIENRTWLTRDYGHLAIHAAARWDGDGARDRNVIKAAETDQEDGGYFDPPLRVEIELGSGRTTRLLPDPKRFVPGAVIAVAVLADVCTAREGCGCGPWAIPGQCHWHLPKVRPLPEPVPCKGRLGLWELPPAVEIAVLDQLQTNREGTRR